MKIVILIPAMMAGGAERVTANLANAWVAMGREVHLITFAPPHTDHYELHHAVRRVGFGMRTWSTNPVGAVLGNAQRVMALRKQLREIKPQVVIGMMTTAAVVAIIAGRSHRCRVVVAEHNYPPLLPVGSAWDHLRSATYPQAHSVVMLTSEGLDWLNAHVPRAHGVVIPNAVSLPLPSVEPLLDPAEFAPAGRKLLLAAGRLVPQKAFDNLIDAFAMVAERHTRWDLVVLGEGPDRPDLEAMTDRLGLSLRIHLPGVAGNMASWYQRADLFVMSSRFEGFPMTLAEALAHGCAAVSYDCDTGPRDLIVDGVNGLLVRPTGDRTALATALDRLMSNGAERLQFATEATKVATLYSPERVLQMWDAIL